MSYPVLILFRRNLGERMLSGFAFLLTWFIASLVAVASGVEPAYLVVLGLPILYAAHMFKVKVRNRKGVRHYSFCRGDSWFDLVLPHLGNLNRGILEPAVLWFAALAVYLYGDLMTVPCAIRPNSKRSYFITTNEAQKVLAACPDDEWQLIFTLCRYGGLRCPSEILLLAWDDIDWKNQRFTVHSPKTEHHDGHDMRIVPLFPEVTEALNRIQSYGGPHSEYVITRYRLNNVNLRTQLNRIIRKAHIEPWPKLFQNLRSSLETELAELFPLHVVTAWLGNSVSVAQKHYLQVTEAHILEASKPQR